MRKSITVQPATSKAYVTFEVVTEKPTGNWKPIAVLTKGELDNYNYFYSPEHKYIAVKE